MKEKTITVSGVTFSAKQVKNAVVIIDGRDITIHDKKKDKIVGFTSKEEQVDENN
jgi:hypothetical protein